MADDTLLVVDEQNVSAEEVFNARGWTEVGRALVAINPELANLLKQQAVHDTLMRLPNRHVPNAPNPVLVDFHRNRRAINDAFHYARPAEPAEPQTFTDRELAQHNLASLFGRNSDSGKANQLGVANPELYKALRINAIKAGLIAR